MRAVEELFGPHSRVMSVLFSSIGLSLVVAVLAAVVGTMTARALVFYDFMGKKFLSFGSVLPIIVPGTVFAMGIHVVFIRMGIADSIIGVILVHIIYALPYTINIMIDITSSLGDSLEVQAHVLGVAPRQAFSHVTFPLLLPGFMASISIGYIISFSQYFLTLMIGGGSVKTFAVMMVPFIQSGDRTISSAYALLFVLSTLAVFVVIEACIKKFAFWHHKKE
ncbi:ABC transporter permease [Serpentinicella alkaliphila]|uniref:Putative spermidine/putrescine transport system permease protein n=1 Tax=Serpentinicella alkaliphila TaxID=1734049 RepID=A0A4R2THC3_9FIRM|nr:ABC transporter permease subunit [Serpentinicella alkaliphila]TCQ02591.1 putative spermidine/putrescine transport system permease protein [Serpentinicella alkaliphila]